MKKFIFMLSIFVCFLSCKKSNSIAGNNVEIYLLKTYKLIPGKCEIDTTASFTQDTATITNEAILQYSPGTYHFTLSTSGIQKIKAFKDFTPFAVTVDKQVIYFGFFKPAVSNSSCDNSITMDVDPANDNECFVRLGYPENSSSSNINDQRNNPVLIATLQNQGKIK